MAAPAAPEGLHRPRLRDRKGVGGTRYWNRYPGARCGANHALVSLIEQDQGADRIEFGGTICLGIADADTTVSRTARLQDGREWLRIGAAELALDCLRRHLLGLSTSAWTSSAASPSRAGPGPTTRSDYGARLILPARRHLNFVL